MNELCKRRHLKALLVAALLMFNFIAVPAAVMPDATIVDAASQSAQKTTIKGMKKTYKVSYNKTISGTITVTPAYGRVVQVKHYNPIRKKWILDATYKTKDAKTDRIKIKLPDAWKSRASSNIIIAVPAAKLQVGGKDVSLAGATKKIVTKNDVVRNVRAAVIMDAETGEVLYEKNGMKHHGTASLTKMMTAMVVMDKVSLDKVVKVNSEATAAKRISGGTGLVPGDAFRVRDLMNGLFISSSNDAAAALAVGVSGSQKNFAKEMNKKAVSLGARNTTYRYAFGDGNSSTYSTAYDQALIGSELMTNSKYQFIRSLMQKDSYTCRSLKYKRKYTFRILQNVKKMKNTGWSIGIKSGDNARAKHCYAAAFKYKGRTYVTVILGTNSYGKVVPMNKKLHSYTEYLVDHNVEMM